MGVETSKSMMWKYERNANKQMSELEPDQGAEAEEQLCTLTADSEQGSRLHRPVAFHLPCETHAGVALGKGCHLKTISCLHAHAICSSSLFQKYSEFEHLEEGYISSNFKHIKKGLSSKVSGKTLFRESQAIPQSDSPHLPQALFLGCSESLYGIIPLTGGRAQANGLC